MRVNIYIQKKNEAIWRGLENHSGWVNKKLKELRESGSGPTKHGASSASKNSSKM